MFIKLLFLPKISFDFGSSWFRIKDWVHKVELFFCQVHYFTFVYFGHHLPFYPQSLSATESFCNSILQSTFVFLPLKNLSAVANLISSPFSFPDYSWTCWAAEAPVMIPVGFHWCLLFTRKIDHLLQLFVSILLVSYPCEDLPSYVS